MARNSPKQRRAGGRDAATGARIPEPLARAIALQNAGHFEVAQALYEKILRLQPRHFDALHLSGLVALELNAPHRAVELISRAIEVNPHHAPAHHNLAITLAELGQFHAAVRSYERALELEPSNAKTHNDRGNALADLGRNAQAVSAYDRAIALDAGYAEAHYNRSCALLALGQSREALASCERALALRPDYAKALNNLGIALGNLGRTGEALAAFERATIVAPDYADAINNQAFALIDLKRSAEAIARFDALLALQPDYPFARGARLRTQMACAEWSDADARSADIVGRVERGERAARPFDVLALCGSPSVQQVTARIWVDARCPPDPALGPPPRPEPRDRIRIGYFSPDFGNHPVSALTAELFERHDRSRFEIYGFSCGPDDGSDLRRRIAAAFDHFIDVQEQSDVEIAQRARSLGIDIAIDVAGFTRGGRTGILALRAAPVQASWLGYLGTMSADYIDYLFADAVIVPGALKGHYTEKIVRLPCYQPNDARRAIAERRFTREDLGLPGSGFVFCSFNDTYKLTPATFDIWMRILRRTEGSVLFLYADEELVSVNLRREAAVRGVDPHRLVFGGRLLVADYLARYHVADLFLDTHPYNAGTTASDALLAGLPVLTYAGEAFASRIAASVVTAAGLPELVTESPKAYVEAAVALAASADRLAALRRRLDESRATAPLFDSVRHTASVEAAYVEMHRRSLAGLAPVDIDIGPAK